MRNATYAESRGLRDALIQGGEDGAVGSQLYQVTVGEVFSRPGR